MRIEFNVVESAFHTQSEKLGGLIRDKANQLAEEARRHADKANALMDKAAFLRQQANLIPRQTLALIADFHGEKLEDHHLVWNERSGGSPTGRITVLGDKAERHPSFEILEGSGAIGGDACHQ